MTDETRRYFQIGFAVAHEGHPVTRFVQSQANVLEEFVRAGIIKMEISPHDDFDYYVYSFEGVLKEK